MKCIDCRRSIAAGIEAQRMVCEYLQADGTVKIFGLQMSDGPLSQATGRLLTGHHNRCYWAATKRRAREAAQGTASEGTTTSYDIARRAVTGEEASHLDPQQALADSAQLAAELHARAELRRTTERRQADPGYSEPAVQDWRAQDEVEIS